MSTYFRRMCGLLYLATVMIHVAQPTQAEPYLALQNGVTCGACHTNVTGGGLRTSFGSGVGRDSMPWTRFDQKTLWSGTLADERLQLGADLRGAYIGNLRDQDPYIGEFVLGPSSLTQASMYCGWNSRDSW